MHISLYHATVPTFLQILGAVAGLVDKAEAHCAEKGLDPAELIGARLAEDMHPFAYQVKSTAVHSFDAIEGVRSGKFGPDRADPPTDFAGLRARVAAAIKGLETVGYTELDAYIGKPVIFSAGDFRIEFVAEDFLLTFSQPNFHFHATTAYDILRWKGLPIGKRDYLGQMRTASSRS
jgi:uncharacterized protein